MLDDSEDASSPEIRGGRHHARLSKLSKHPRNLYLLWDKWEIGLNETKPAKDLNVEERGVQRFKFCRRKVFWDAVSGMILRGLSSRVAIDRLYGYYGRRMSVSSILDKMLNDRKNGRDLTDL